MFGRQWGELLTRSWEWKGQSYLPKYTKLSDISILTRNFLTAVLKLDEPVSVKKILYFVTFRERVESTQFINIYTELRYRFSCEAWCKRKFSPKASLSFSSCKSSSDISASSRSSSSPLAFRNFSNNPDG